MEETIVETTPIASADDVVAAIMGETTEPVAYCPSASPNGILTCELHAHSNEIPHQFTFQTINGPQVTYWF
jgi:hypothetical protein